MSVLGATAVAAGISALASGLNNWYNARQVKKTNQYNEALMRESWQREDTAVQRRVADLKEAGLSPLLAAGDAAQTSGPISTQSHKSDFNIDALQALQLAQQIKESDAGIALTKAKTLNEGLQSAFIQAQTESLLNENRTFDEKFALYKAKEQAQTFLFDMEGKIKQVEYGYAPAKISAEIRNMTDIHNQNIVKLANLQLEGKLTEKNIENVASLISFRALEGEKVSAETKRIVFQTTYDILKYNMDVYDFAYSIGFGLRTFDPGTSMLGLKPQQFSEMFNDLFGKGATKDSWLKNNLRFY